MYNSKVTVNFRGFWVSPKRRLQKIIENGDEMLFHRAESKCIFGYESWIAQWFEAKCDVYFLSVLFRHLGCGDESALGQMEQELERFYTTLLTRVVRNPSRATNGHKLPIMVAAPDRPVGKKWGDMRLHKKRPNNGIHWHALIAIPAESRLQEDLSGHLISNDALYRGRERKIAEIHCARVVNAGGNLADYMLKHIKRGSFDSRSILVLPRARSELFSDQRATVAVYI